MKEKQRARWAQIRIKGKTRFIWVNGVLFWGIPMFVFMSFLFLPFESGDILNLTVIVTQAVIWVLGGLAFGLLTWTMSERTFLKTPPDNGLQDN
tara:strand:- start:242 stop:523 length:282 start_codon:yes stop_codon:yes gene_type:complete